MVFQNKKNMTAIELKKLVLQRISEINDISFLSALNSILESKLHTKKISLSAEQLNEILLSKKEIEAGIFTEQHAMDKEFEKWLKEK
jgi:hypothetical protein